jgi:MSHA pilin protein MshC
VQAATAWGAPAQAAQPGRTRARKAALGVAQPKGFTLIELIMVLVIVGVLAIFVAPRMLSMQDVRARGLHDETLAYLRYAQKTAIAQRRTLCVTFTSNALSLSQAQNAGTLNCTPAVASLYGPKGEKPPQIVPASGSSATYTSTPATLSFDSQGQPRNAAGALLTANAQIQVAGLGKTITVTANTGYTYDSN